MKILLLGASGRTGREVIERALAVGDAVTALVRAKDRLADIHHERLVIAVGSPCDPKVLEPLMVDCDVVISALGPRRPWKSACAIYPESAAAIVEAMEQGGVQRLLVTSSGLLFADDSLFSSALRWLVPDIVDGARQMEARIRASNLDWTIARTGFLNNDSATDYDLAVGAMPEDSGAISRAAVAHFLLTEAGQSNHSRQVVGLSG